MSGSAGFPPFPTHATRTVKVDIAKYFDIPGPGTYTIEFSKMSLRSNLLTVTLLPGYAITPSQRPAPSSMVFAAPSSSGAARENFSLQIEVDRSTVLVGKEIPVYTRLANLSAATIHVPVTASGLGLGLDVRDANGQPVPETELGGLRKRWAQETPGQFKATPRFRIAGSVDLAKFLDMATPGAYTVQLYWDVPGDLGGGQVRSNVLQITVRARNTQ